MKWKRIQELSFNFPKSANSSKNYINMQKKENYRENFENIRLKDFSSVAIKLTFESIRYVRYLSNLNNTKYTV